MHEPKLGVWDFVAVGGYFAAVIGAGIFVSVYCYIEPGAPARFHARVGKHFGGKFGGKRRQFFSLPTLFFSLPTLDLITWVDKVGVSTSVLGHFVPWSLWS